MSNLILFHLHSLAETAPGPGIEAAPGLLGVMIIMVWALISLLLIQQRQLYRTPHPPVPGTGILMLALAGALGVTSYLAAGGICAHLLGITQDNVGTPESTRRMLLCQPAVQLFTAGVVIAALAPYLPGALHWSRGWVGPIAKGAASYPLAMPWVLIVGAITTLVAREVDPDVSTKHVIFDLWLKEDAGVTPYKAAAVFSAVIGAPLVEELVFRGVLQRLVHRVTGGLVLSIVVASVAFTVIHQPWTMQPPVFVLSLFLGFVYFRTGSILAPIVMHAIFNAIQFAIFMATMHSLPAA